MPKKNRKTFFALYRPRPRANPFFSRHEKKRPAKKVFASALLVLILILGFVFLSPVFVIDKIIVEGGERIPSEKMEESIMEALSKRSYSFLYDKQTVRKRLMELYPVEYVSFNVKFPRELRITVTLRTPAMIFRYGERTALMDKNGILMQMENIDESSLFVVDFGQPPSDLGAGERILPQAVAQNLLAVREELQSKTSLEIVSARLETADSGSVEYEVGEGWRIILDLNKDIPAQLVKFYAVFESELQNRENLEYVDLRFEDRVYYK